jgi:hypothetical protein
MSGKGMHGKNLGLITMQCTVCERWFTLRVDQDDLDRHLRHGVYVQYAFTNRDGKPYLDAAERELFISKVCSDCWALLCPSSRIAYN